MELYFLVGHKKNWRASDAKLGKKRGGARSLAHPKAVFFSQMFLTGEFRPWYFQAAAAAAAAAERNREKKERETLETV